MVKILAMAAIAFCATGVFAKQPVKMSVDVAPAAIVAGQALAITSSVTNHSDDAQSFTVQIEMRGPCGVSGSKGYKVLLTAGQSDKSQASFPAPSCVGEYDAVMTIADHDGSIIGTATRRFHVNPPDRNLAKAK